MSQLIFLIAVLPGPVSGADIFWTVNSNFAATMLCGLCYLQITAYKKAVILTRREEIRRINVESARCFVGMQKGQTCIFFYFIVYFYLPRSGITSLKIGGVFRKYWMI